MKPVKLRIVSGAGVEATIRCDGSRGVHDYRANVSIAGQLEDKEVYGVDPVQAFQLGLFLIERLTQDKRIGQDGEDPMPGTNWRVEVVEN